MGEQLVCQTEGISADDLNYNNFGASVMALLASCIVAGWFCSTATI